MTRDELIEELKRCPYNSEVTVHGFKIDEIRSIPSIELLSSALDEDLDALRDADHGDFD
jgi:hypothetical protein